MANLISQTIFKDNFEAYEVNTFPNSVGWNLVYSGFGEEYQVVTDQTSISNPNSMKLEGQSNWAAVMRKEVTIPNNAVNIWYEANVRVTKVEPSVMNYPDAIVGITDGSSWDNFVIFHYDGNVYLKWNNYIQKYNYDEWYKIKVKQDILTGIGSIWINDILKFDNINLGNIPINTFIELQAGNDAHTRCWFDDVKVWYDTETGIKQNINIEYKVYPNPTKESITINFNNQSHSIKQISLLDVFGKIALIIDNPEINSGSYKIDVSNLKDGLYFLYIQTPKGTITKKITIIH